MSDFPALASIILFTPTKNDENRTQVAFDIFQFGLYLGMFLRVTDAKIIIAGPMSNSAKTAHPTKYLIPNIMTAVCDIVTRS
jgi:hypothetical protein